MKKLLYFIPLFLGVALTFTSCYKDEIENLKQRLEAIEGTQIASIQGQITAINSTLPKLEKADGELEGYIGRLQNTTTSLQNSINSANSKINEIEASLNKDQADREQLLAQLAQLADFKDEMESEVSAINAAIVILKAKDSELDKKIVDLKDYVDAELAYNKNWANATFATLDQYSEIAGDIEAVKASIAAVNGSLVSLENNIKKLLKQS